MMNFTIQDEGFYHSMEGVQFELVTQGSEADGWITQERTTFIDIFRVA